MLLLNKYELTTVFKNNQTSKAKAEEGDTHKQ